MAQMSTFNTGREFEATPSMIFAAIKDPVRLARWWGPEGFSNRFEVFEFEPGGNWTFSMMGPDGKIYPNESRFAAIEAERLVVIQHLSQPYFQLTITLEPTADGTLLTWEQAFADAAVASAVRHIVEPANEQNLDRLGAEVRRGNGAPV
jgi:uncharacterized protein YndB with AHSA1/START domain